MGERVLDAARLLQGLKRNRLAGYRPYLKQREFHAAGLEHRERCLMAGNQLGKTLSAGFEVAMHLTGQYPEWWEGKRFPGPTKWWASNTNLETTRDNPQRILFGEDLDGELGKGTIPWDCIEKIDKSRGMSNAVDRALIKHVSGGFSQIWFKAYDQERKKWQGQTLHGVWFDEEPPADVYSEGLTRTNTTNGITLLTATPLLGMTEVMGWFYPRPNTKHRALVQMTDEDAEHLTAEDRARNLAGYRAHEKEARAKGIPMLGAGKVFPIPEGDILIEPFKLPDHYKQLVGLDFGYDHPTAAARVAWDEENDIHYIVAEYRMREESPVVHAAAIKRWGDWLPVVWPHDGWQHDKVSGKTTADLYRQEGLRMWHEHATFRDGGYGLEAGIMEMLDRMRTGRFRVFESCVRWVEEFRMYHRREGRSREDSSRGKIVKEQDDLLSASRYAMMMARKGGAARRPEAHLQTAPRTAYDWKPGAREEFSTW